MNNASSPNVSAYGPGLSYGVANKTATFTVFTEDASEGTLATGGGGAELLVILVTAEGAVMTAFVIVVLCCNRFFCHHGICCKSYTFVAATELVSIILKPQEFEEIALFLFFLYQKGQTAVHTVFQNWKSFSKQDFLETIHVCYFFLDT